MALPVLRDRCGQAARGRRPRRSRSWHWAHMDGHRSLARRSHCATAGLVRSWLAPSRNSVRV